MLFEVVQYFWDGAEPTSFTVVGLQQERKTIRVRYEQTSFDNGFLLDRIHLSQEGDLKSRNVSGGPISSGEIQGRPVKGRGTPAFEFEAPVEAGTVVRYMSFSGGGLVLPVPTLPP